MAESKFLRFQDKNNDNLIDTCERDDVEPLIDNCPACKPNPAATVPDWKTKTIDEPFYNARTGAYQVTVVTQYKSTGGYGLSEEDAAEVLAGRFYEHVGPAITALLEGFEKSKTTEFQDLCRTFIEYKDYDLAPHASSRLKLLYSIPCQYFYNIPSEEEQAAYEDANEQEDEENSSSVALGTIEIDAETFIEYSINVRRGLELYGRYLKVFRATEKGNFVFDEGPSAGAILNLELYGDIGFVAQNSLMGKAQEAIVKFLKDNEILVPSTNWFATNTDRAKNITITLKEAPDGLRKIETIKVTTELCGTIEKEFKGAKIRRLLAETPALNDQTVLGYLQNLSAMNTDLTARTPKPWIEFVEEHTVPAVTSTINYSLGAQFGTTSGGGCIQNRLQEGTVQLGQDLLDPTFGIGDAIAYKFRFRACEKDQDNYVELQEQIGTVLRHQDPVLGHDINTDPTLEVHLDVGAHLIGLGYTEDEVGAVLLAYAHFRNTSALAGVNHRQLELGPGLRYQYIEYEGSQIYMTQPEAEAYMIEQMIARGWAEDPALGRRRTLTADQLREVNRVYPDVIFRHWTFGEVTRRDDLGGFRTDQSYVDVLNHLLFSAQEVYAGTATSEQSDIEPWVSIQQVSGRASPRLVSAWQQLVEHEIYADTRHATSISTADHLGHESHAAATNLWDYAREQAFGDIDNSNQIFGSFCNKAYGDDEAVMEALMSIKVCGFSELVLESISCLMQGLSFDDAMSKILESALKAMNIQTFFDLFLGLPPDKRQELDELVQRKIENGDIFGGPDSPNQEISDAIDEAAFSNVSAEYRTRTDVGEPGLGTAPAEYDNPQAMEGVLGRDRATTTGTVLPREELELAVARARSGAPAVRENRPLFEQLDAGSETNRKQLSENMILQLYIQGLLEVYQDNLLEALDLLNGIPGAPIIAQTISALNCPVPPTNVTNGYDFINDLEIGNPLCNSNWDYTIPEFVFQNPFSLGIGVNIKDTFSLLKPGIIQAINETIIQLMVAALQKVCQLIGSSTCEAIKTGSSAFTALPDALTGRQSLQNIMKNAFCGQGADPALVDESIVDLVANLGLGAAAFANTQRTLDYMYDIASITTAEGLASAVLGEGSDEFAESAYQIRKMEYPEFEAALPHKDAVKQLFKNAGNLMPLGFRQQLKDYLDKRQAASPLASNPSLCASPGELEALEARRCAILAGRATKSQCESMSPRKERLQDLEDLATMIQNPDQMYEQPLVSDPGCDNAPIPFQPEAVVSTATAILNYELNLLRIAFADDIIGNGPLKSDYGMLNMILSDTQGNPLSAHNRKVSQDLGEQNYVDYYFDTQPASTAALSVQKYAITAKQEGAYPLKVASWLQLQLNNSASNFSSNNTFQGSKILGSYDYNEQDSTIIGMGNTERYNIIYKSLPESQLLAIAQPRKADPDLTMEFYDNRNGYGSGWSEGFKVEGYISDLIKSTTITSATYSPELSSSSEILSPNNESLNSEGGAWSFDGPTLSGEQRVINLPSDNMRVKISSMQNLAPPAVSALIAQYGSPEEANTLVNNALDALTSTQIEFEFMSIDGYFSGSQFTAPWIDVDMYEYPEFLSAFEHRRQHTPQVILLKEMIDHQRLLASAEPINIDSVKAYHDFFMSTFLQGVMTSVSGNAPAFTYGALLDELSAEDTEYVVAAGQSNAAPGQSYYEATVTVPDESGENETRKITEEDKILGISRMQHNMELAGTPDENRVFYLDPETFGGKYMNPPFYVKPMVNKAWLGMLDVMFPGESACKPAKSDVIVFDDIGEKVEKTFQTIPANPDLGSDPSCFIEMPYQRVLERYSVAAIEGIITATIRSYVGAHFMKSLATLTHFKPDFVNNYSSAYTQYIVERMERDLRDAQQSLEWLNPFKDEEFWYAFLEQGVQLYSRRVGPDGDIVNAPDHIVDAMRRLNDGIERYMQTAKPRAQWEKENAGLNVFQTLTLGLANTFTETYEEYSARKVYEFVQSTEEDAKIIFGELVKEQIQHVSDKFLENLKSLNWEPAVTNLDYYVLQNYTLGGIGLDLDKEIKEQYWELQEGDDQYTTGGEFSTPTGDDYVGYYHSHVNDIGNVVFMTGEEHVDAEHEILTPAASKIIVPIGDVAEYGTEFEGDTNRPFIIEKYVKIDGSKYSPSRGKEIVQSHASTTNISDHYPGTLELVYNDSDEPIGLTGELGVRCGLQLSMYVSEKLMAFQAFVDEVASGTANLPLSVTEAIAELIAEAGVNDVYELIETSSAGKIALEGYFLTYSTATYGEDLKIILVETEVDALDTTVDKFTGIEANSKLLLCLINNLIEEPKFKIINKYIFPFNKLVSLTAIYNDLGLLASIGQVSVPQGAAKGNSEVATKPGQYIEISGETISLRDGAIGWAHPLDRSQSIFVLEYDNWEQNLMSNVRGRAKSLFKGHYMSRNFTGTESVQQTAMDPVAPALRNLRLPLNLQPGERLGLPRWKKEKQLNTNPFNSKGQICAKDGN